MRCVAELDEDYIGRMEDILAVYEKLWNEREPLVCLDEKPVVLHYDIRPPRTMRPGRVARQDGEYRCCGTAPENVTRKSKDLPIWGYCLCVFFWICAFMVTDFVSTALVPKPTSVWPIDVDSAFLSWGDERILY